MKTFIKNNKKNFLIIRLSSLGDVILTTPLIRCIKKIYPDSTVDFIVNRQFSDVIKYNPYINNIIEFDKKNINSIGKINFNENYQIIDLQNNLTSRKIKKYLKNQISEKNKNIQSIKFNKKLWQKIALVWFKKNLFDSKTIPERYIETAKTFNITNDNEGLEVWLPEENNSIYAPSKQNNSAQTTSKKIIITVAPAAKHRTKQWLPEYFVELINKINKKYHCEIHLLGGEDAVDICKHITNNLNFKIEDYSGKTSILDVVRILDKSNILISNDTGLLHLGAARHIPIVAIYGSTTVEFGFTPYHTPHIICETKLKCRPCSHIGRKKCHHKHFNCMRLLYPEIVFSNFEKLLFSSTFFHSHYKKLS